MFLEQGYVVSPEMDQRMGLNGNILAVEPLVQGMSGGQVLKVITESTNPLVIKTNVDRPYRVQREIAGYEALKGSLIEPYLTMPLYSSSADGVIVLPFFSGIELRRGLQKGIIPPDTAMGVLKEVIALKEKWWSGQEKQPGDKYLSMQREEWPETEELVDIAVAKIAQEFQIPASGITDRSFIINNVIHPPLKDTIERTKSVLEIDPPYTNTVHGDISGGNTLVDLETGEIKFIDTEWSGENYPAEPFVRVTKQESTTTAQKADVTEVLFDGKTVEFRLEAQYHPLTSSMHREGLGSVRRMGESLQDPNFAEQYLDYLKGSYLRELALAPKRKNEHFAVLALYSASKKVTLYD